MAQKLKPPYKLLICIVDRNKIDEISKCLNDEQEPVHLTCLAEGTRRLGIFDMLGVGRIDRSVLFGFVRSSKSTKILKMLDAILIQDEDKSYGWAFTTSLASISSEALNYLASNQKASKDLAKEQEAKEEEKVKEVAKEQEVSQPETEKKE